MKKTIQVLLFLIALAITNSTYKINYANNGLCDPFGKGKLEFILKSEDPITSFLEFNLKLKSQEGKEDINATCTKGEFSTQTPNQVTDSKNEMEESTKEEEGFFDEEEKEKGEESKDQDSNEQETEEGKEEEPAKHEKESGEKEKETIEKEKEGGEEKELEKEKEDGKETEERAKE